MSATIDASGDWQKLVYNINREIFVIYLKYKNWYAETTSSIRSTSGSNTELIFPESFAFYHAHPEIANLLGKSISITCDNGSYEDLYDQLAKLRIIITYKDGKRDDCMSSCFLAAPGITAEQRTRVTVALIAGRIMKKFDHDVVCTADWSDPSKIAGSFIRKAVELNCPAVSLLLAMINIDEETSGCVVRTPLASPLWLDRTRSLTADSAKPKSINELCEIIQSFDFDNDEDLFC